MSSILSGCCVCTPVGRVVEDLKRTAHPRAQLEIMIADMTDFK